MKVYKNLMGSNDKIHASNIVVGDKSENNLLSSILHSCGINGRDTRTKDWLPNEVPLGTHTSIRADFKRTDVLGLPESSYVTLITIKPWSDSSGGRVTQIAFSNAHIYVRRSNSSWSAWEDWEKLNAGMGFDQRYSATYKNGWTGSLEYSKNSYLGLVHLSGRIYPGDTAKGTVISTLPAGYRPNTMKALTTYDSMRGECYIGLFLNSSGNLIIRRPYSDEIRDDAYPYINTIYWIGA